MHTDIRTLDVNLERFFGTKPTRVDDAFAISLAEQSYLPKVDDPRADWVVVAAFNAFQAFQQGQLGKVERFATIGTGSGTDVVAALETFPQLKFAAMTDLHQSVVDVAKHNVVSATQGSAPVVRRVAERIFAADGDLLQPLEGQAAFDLIYENLPNIPLSTSSSTTDTLVREGQTSSTFVGDRSADGVPAHVSAAMLDLHYLCLRQARVKQLVNPKTGVILSSIGGRVPVQAMLDMARAAGYTARVVSLAWKVQSEPHTVIGEYAESQKSGLGTYYFYPTSALASVFNHLSPATAALHSDWIEQQLLPHRLDAVTAYRQHCEGIEIGHTVVVIASVFGVVGEDGDTVRSIL
ncbi:uncharacterized protein B0I36DRAFT_295397 [Microdochium trichocladiopsis]|uniref:Uncharacterized protein n=1 Tax=Microdochium trichocladiopsis TaxID=1682393 RepID=A0A9P8XXP8_9PEZI|nr:uncharacterized protein B0I36DRAFT_295397 [Microdochium trichocladiopsis]KAH7024722.1 hypothetical protein B0I36DRAFT_295397 [Microdochium trichocladiopsis]